MVYEGPVSGQENNAKPLYVFTNTICKYTYGGFSFVLLPGNRTLKNHVNSLGFSSSCSKAI